MINYCLITKPGIILGNLLTVAAGFFLASKGTINGWLFIETLGGLALIIASACIFNNYIDRHLDRKMDRTKKRALASGSISTFNALAFAIILGLLGNAILFLYTNLLTVCVADAGFIIYVLLYSLWKSRTIYSTAIGSIAGAVPPVVGYCAVSHQLDFGAILLFFLLVLWQMPHFFAIALYHFEDYSQANIPTLPVIKGMMRTKIHMLLYITGFLFNVYLLTYYTYTGQTYLVVTFSLGLMWLALCLKGFTSSDNQLWGRQMFQMSLVLITTMCLIIPFDIANPLQIDFTQHFTDWNSVAIIKFCRNIFYCIS